MIETPLKDYPGSKGGAGVYQRILNKIPDAPVMLFPFLGSGQIFRRLDHSRSRIFINDYDPKVFAAWDESGIISPDRVGLSCLHFYDFLVMNERNSTFVYCDPTYMMDTRSGGVLYRCEMSKKDHVRLLEWAQKTDSRVIISHPVNKLYSTMLSDWSIEEFDYMTRGGLRQDAIWYNYDPNAFPLNTYEFLGENFTKRQTMKRQAQNIIKKLSKLDLHTRDRVMRQVIEEFNYGN